MAYVHSWALVFVVMIVGYGTLVPSTWRRCTVMVGLMALTPVLLLARAGPSTGATLVGPLGTNLVELVIWLAIASGIAIFGAHRIEVLRQRHSRRASSGSMSWTKAWERAGWEKCTSRSTCY